ncbi:HNH endonuclease signature motif containing protein, partial [Corynebacterium frankenforstense]
LLDEYNGPAEPAPQTRSLQFINSKTKGQGLLFRGPSAEIAALRHAAHTAAAKAVGEDNVDAEACGEAFADMLTRGFPQSVLRPVVGVSLNEAVRIEDGHGDDIELVASDGSRMTGSEFLQRLLRQAGTTRPAAEPGAQTEATFDADTLGDTDRPTGTTTTGVDADGVRGHRDQAATSVLTPAKDAPTEDAVTTGPRSDPGSAQDPAPEAEPGATLVPVPAADAAAGNDTATADGNEDAADLELFAAEIPTRIPEMIFDADSMIMLVHPTQGPSNLYRTRRFANGKQRTMLGATFGVCAHPECNQPAEFCQADHDIAWVRGGMTNIDNLTPLCRYHNGANDDDPEGPVRHGRIERDGLDVYRVLPGGRRQRDATPTLARRMMAEHAARRTAQAA